MVLRQVVSVVSELTADSEILCFEGNLCDANSWSQQI